MKKIKLAFWGCLLGGLLVSASSLLPGRAPDKAPAPADPYKAKEKVNASVSVPGGVKLPMALDGEGTTLYGSMLWSNSWTPIEVPSDRPYGVYSFTDSSLTPQKCFATEPDALTGVYVDGIYYEVTRLMDSFNTLYDIHITSYDAETGAKLGVVNIYEPRYSKLPLLLAYDSSKGVTYALTYADDNQSHLLATINLSTGEMSSIGSLGNVSSSINYLTFSVVEGKILSVASDGNLYSIDPVTAEVEVVGPLGMSPAYLQSTAYDPSTGTLWWAASLASGEGMLCKINTSTGAAERVGMFADSEEFIGLYVKTSTVDPAAPARVSALRFEPSTPGSLAGNLTFGMPELTNGGAQLQGELMAEVKVDGAEISVLRGAPGASMSVPLTLEAGQRTITVAVKSGELSGSAAPLTLWAGPDAPAPVTDLKLVLDGDVMKLTWTASATGQHGGYCPSADVRYRIMDNDGVVVAEAHETTEFTVAVPPAIADHRYTVTPFIPGGAEGISVTSNILRAGEYYNLPVMFDFNFDNDFHSDFLVHDMNEDGCTWNFHYTWDENNVADVQYNASWVNQADDYLVSPGLNLSSGTMYQVSFDHSTGIEIQESIKILVGKGREVADLTQLVADYSNIITSSSTRQSARFTVPEDGVYYVALYIYSPVGQSYFSVDNMEIKAMGSSLAPAKPVVELAAETIGGADKVYVKITAPSSTISGEPLSELSAVEVYRGDGEEPVHTFASPALGALLEWTDENPGSGPVRYRVVALNSEGAGEPDENEVFVGGLNPPYTAGFDSAEELTYYTILNVNGDESTWNWENGSMTYSYNLFEPADDWLFTPNMRLSADRVYEVVAMARTGMYDESLSITYGVGTDPASQVTLLDLPEFNSPEIATECPAYLKIPADGCYNIGFHAYSPKNRLQLYLDEISIKDVASANAPDVVTGFSVTADPTGAHKALVAFTVPAKTCAEDPLLALASVEIYRGYEDEPVKVISNPVPGAAINWTDENAVHGQAVYRVCAVNADGRGLVSKASAFVGLDTPAAVESLRAKGNATNANAVLTWEAPGTGMNGGYINPDELTYTVTRIEDYSPTVIASGISALTFTDELGAEGKQKVISYAVTPTNLYGTGPEASASVKLGTLYDMPLVQMFKDYTALGDEWTNEILTNYNGSWMVSFEEGGVTSVDEGTGFLHFNKWSEEEGLSAGILSSPKVSMSKALKPYITLSFYHNPEADPRAHMKVGYRINDGDLIELEDIAVNSKPLGWMEYSWPVMAASEDFVSVELYAESYDNITRMFVDNLSIDDKLDHNLAVDNFTGPEEISREGAAYTVTVRNKGSLDAAGYDVILLCNGSETITLHEEALASGETRATEFSIPAPAAPDGDGQRIYQARVDYAADMKPADNFSAEIHARVIPSDYPGISDLEASNTDAGVALNWSEPSVVYAPPVTDSFESLTPFAIDGFDPWSLYDGDGQRTIGIRYGLTFTDWYTPKAWQVWDPMRVALLGDDVAPHSGHLCLISMQSDGTIPGDEVYYTPANDDWLISEQVAGGSVVTFWLMQPVNNYGGNEAVEVLYSTEGDSPEDFQALATVELADKATWTRHQFTLPADAQFFAIRHHQSYFGLWLDDITYSPTSGSVNLSIEGYNIYRDNELIATATTPSYTDASPLQGVHRYAVAAKFNVGEGPLSNVVELDTSDSGIGGVSDSEGCVITPGRGFIRITGAADDRVEVIAADGRVIKSLTVNGSAVIKIASGVYIVKVGSTVKKIKVS